MNIGEKMPSTLGLDQNGNEITLASLAGKKVILYAYPKDNTSGCTAEACSLKDHYDELQQAGYAVIGVSKDSAASHQKFIEKYSLPFPLIADTDHSNSACLRKNNRSNCFPDIHTGSQGFYMTL